MICLVKSEMVSLFLTRFRNRRRFLVAVLSGSQFPVARGTGRLDRVSKGPAEVPG